MSEPYLIAHVVRGQPAFDIAEKMRCPKCHGVGGAGVLDFETNEPNDYEGPACGSCEGEGFWWIIPTSGHRAKPYWNALLHNVALGGTLRIKVLAGEAPPDWPDHYPCNATPRKPAEAKKGAADLLKELGL